MHFRKDLFTLWALFKGRDSASHNAILVEKLLNWEAGWETFRGKMNFFFKVLDLFLKSVIELNSLFSKSLFLFAERSHVPHPLFPSLSRPLVWALTVYSARVMGVGWVPLATNYRVPIIRRTAFNLVCPQFHEDVD